MLLAELRVHGALMTSIKATMARVGVRQEKQKEK